MVITMPNFSIHTVVIDNTYKNGASKISSGFLTDVDSSSIVITAGKDSVYAIITTPDGSYSFQTFAGKGFLYKVPTRSSLETSETDALIPNTL
ncbi:MAG: hypothetical protein QS721_03190 [Candidatus Endonucleobacter sp. (ex Gigantidas childressi)]|nr:hypothetical protein [Candidatus Endonucleobacter sp. (ex Gigantidas childressi)]